jgi:carbon-monoxide dehydrogenase medium subunit
LKRFEYFAATNISEAFDLLDKYGERIKLLAGGTDLLVQMKNNKIEQNYLLDLKKIQDLSGIYPTANGGCKIGPLTTVSELESSEVIEKIIPILSEAGKTIGSPQIRNRATVGGNVCWAAPSADLVPALLVLEAQLTISSRGAERVVPIQEFFLSPGQTILKENEILTGIRIPHPPASAAGVYLKHGLRQTMDLAIVGAAVLIAFDPMTYICKDAKIALASVAPIPLRANAAEKALSGKALTQAAVEEAAKMAAVEASPITDVYGPDWYKKDLVPVLVKRAINEALRRIQGHTHET